MTAVTQPGEARPPPLRRLTTLLAFVAAAIVALAVGIYAGMDRRDGATASAATLFALTLPDSHGQQQPFAQWQGKVLVVNFWATWCAPCREEMPQFMRAQAEFGSRGLQFVGIAADEPGKVRQFVDEMGLNYPALIGGYGAMELSKTFGNKLMALPFTLVIDREGRVIHTQLGRLSDEKLRALAAKAL
jgi:peroxiredoxin